MFTTNLNHFPHTSRPMSLQEVDENGTLWFISSSDSHKNAELNVDRRVTLYFQNKSSYEFLLVNGEATIYVDKGMIDQHWTEFAKAWFDGKDDPRVSVIAVKPLDCDYWDTKNGKIVSFIKMSFNALTGSKGDDGGIEGKLHVAK
jgi:general stress protein 26